MSTTTTEQSLDALLSELVQNADDWAALKSDLIDSPASPSSADGQQHPCFDQLSRAISSHVTDLLLKRLRLAGRGEDEAAENEDTDDEDRPWIDERGRERRGRGFPPARQRLGSDSLRSSRGSLSSRDSPASSGVGARVVGAANAAPPPVVRGRAQARGAQPAPLSSTTPSRAGSTCSLATIGSRYHSENRLDRAYPAARPDETPLENRASRLRRMSIERRAAERNVRSAAASPAPQRRSASRRSSGCGGK